MSLRQAVFSIVILAHQSVVMLDAIARALVRQVVTRRHLLEWVTADRADNGHASVWQVARRMWTAPAVALAITAVVAIVAPGRLLLASPILVLWFISPALVYVCRTAAGCTRARRSAESERAALRRVARRTWRFFEELVGPSDHWLIPDNYQEDRHDVIAHRTSPTNIGLQVLSTLAACDFGYLELRRRRSIASSRRSTRFCECSAIVDTSTTGTTRERSHRSCRRTSRRSTAATSPAIC